jgi:thiol-disulfide isomerase/thioredoxin
MRWLFVLVTVLAIGLIIIMSSHPPEEKYPAEKWSRTPPPANPKVGLRVGQLAPEIVGQDLDGNNFKLSDYRGKVVLLDFWFLDCPPCRALYPHNRVLMKKYADKPFALLGVNYNDSVDRLRKVRADGLVTWRFWMSTPATPITDQWHVEAFPTLILIDQQGVIRENEVRRPDVIDSAIEMLLDEKKRV